MAATAATDIEQPPLQLRMTNNRHCIQGCRTTATAEVERPLLLTKGPCTRISKATRKNACPLLRVHDIFHVFLQEHENRSLLLMWAGVPEVRAVQLTGSNCLPLLVSQVLHGGIEL